MTERKWLSVCAAFALGEGVASLAPGFAEAWPVPVFAMLLLAFWGLAFSLPGWKLGCVFAAGMAVFLDKQRAYDRDSAISDLIDIQYDRNDYELTRGTFRVRGDALDVFPAYADNPIHIEFWDDEIDTIAEVDHITGEVLNLYEALPMP